MVRRKLTEEDKIFIANNRLKMSITKMSEKIGSSYSSIHTHMRKEGLILTKEERTTRTKLYPKKRTIKVKWVPNPWDHKLNLVTMLKVNNQK